MTPGIPGVWEGMSGSALLWLTVTIVVYSAARAAYRRCGQHPLVNPVLLSVMILIAVLFLTKTPYSTYFTGVQFLHFLLGPATVALALPLHAQMSRLRTMLTPMIVALVVGSVTAIGSAVALGSMLNASSEVLLSLAPKSTTMPIAMGVTDQLGGVASLTTLTVTLTGLSGTIMARRVLALMRINDLAVRGFTVGVTAHAIGTAYALQLGETAGAFAALGMGLNGIATTALVPLMLQFWPIR